MTERLIYDASREELVNLLFQIDMLKEEGVGVGSLEDETFNRLVDLIDTEDTRKLGEVRRELHDQTREP